MKKLAVFKIDLLISQDEMAMLLHTNKSQWSMYEIGQRGLPKKSRDKLLVLLKLANELPKTSEKKRVEIVKQVANKQFLLGKQLQDVVVKQLRLERKLNNMQSKYQAALNTLDFVNLVATKKEKDTFEQEALYFIEQNALKTTNIHNLYKQTELEIKLASLQLEKELIEKEMKIDKRQE